MAILQGYVSGFLLISFIEDVLMDGADIGAWVPLMADLTPELSELGCVMF
jgi:hypothetical protein